MHNLPSTRPSLLLRLRDSRDQAAWETFVELYAPAVFRFAHRQGLQEADAADLTQEVFRAVAAAIGQLLYAPERGSFRGWFFILVRNELRTFLKRLARTVRGRGGEATRKLLEEQPSADEPLEAAWERECHQRLFAWAVEQVRPQVSATTWNAFWLTAVEGQSGKQVADQLEMSVAAVYLAKGRVLARLRAQVQQVHEEGEAF